MNGTLAINNNLQALKRILAGLVEMAGLGCLSSPLAGEDGSARQGKAEPLAEPGEGSFSGNRPTLPRHLRLAILRLLRPAESAARRLIIAAARGLTVTLPPPRPSRPKPVSPVPTLRRFGIAVTLSPRDLEAGLILPRSRGSGTARRAVEGAAFGQSPSPSSTRSARSAGMPAALCPRTPLRASSFPALPSRVRFRRRRRATTRSTPRASPSASPPLPPRSAISRGRPERFARRRQGARSRMTVGPPHLAAASRPSARRTSHALRSLVHPPPPRPRGRRNPRPRPRARPPRAAAPRHVMTVSSVCASMDKFARAAHFARHETGAHA